MSLVVCSVHRHNISSAHTGSGSDSIRAHKHTDTRALTHIHTHERNNERVRPLSWKNRFASQHASLHLDVAANAQPTQHTAQRDGVHTQIFDSDKRQRHTPPVQSNTSSPNGQRTHPHRFNRHASATVESGDSDAQVAGIDDAGLLGGRVRDLDIGYVYTYLAAIARIGMGST